MALPKQASALHSHSAEAHKDVLSQLLEAHPAAIAVALAVPLTVYIVS